MSFDANGNRLTKTGGPAAESIIWDGENRPSLITVGVGFLKRPLFPPTGAHLAGGCFGHPASLWPGWQPPGTVR